MEHGKLTRAELEEILEKIRGVKLCVIGDLCLDLYWCADPARSRLSRETLRPNMPITEEYCYPGAAGNIICNTAALGARDNFLLSAAARDWRGALLLEQLAVRGIPLDGVFHLSRGVTPCYCRTFAADRRETAEALCSIDFMNSEVLCAIDEEKILAALDDAAGKADVIAVCDQMEYGVVTERIREKLSALSKKIPVIADSRDRISKFVGTIVKPNELEAADAAGRDPYTHWELGVYEEIARDLERKNGSPALVTLGARGSLWAEKGSVLHLPAARIEPPYDPIGAGDTFLAAFACAYAATGDGARSAAFANLAAAVTVRKSGITGTAAPEEIRALWSTQP